MNDDMFCGAKGKRVLITRPREQARSLVDALTNLGAVPLSLPVIEIRPLADDQVERQKIIDLDLYDKIVVVSANAARLALDWIDRYWPQLPPHPEWYAVGGATARLLAAEGIFAQVPEAESNSEGLLALAGLNEVGDRKILVIKGTGGRTLLQDELSRRNAVVDNLELYSRALPKYEVSEINQVLGASSPDAMVVTSVEALGNLEQLLTRAGNAHYSVPLVVASKRIAEVARSSGYTSVTAAEGASDDCILRALNVIG